MVCFDGIMLILHICSVGIIYREMFVLKCYRTLEATELEYIFFIAVKIFELDIDIDSSMSFSNGV